MPQFSESPSAERQYKGRSSRNRTGLQTLHRVRHCPHLKRVLEACLPPNIVM
ncbi:hypothetical protein M422DRAFT_31812, partial [Sphaerobolus stellatus SS14]